MTLREQLVVRLRRIADCIAKKIPPIWVCPDCGGTRIEATAWVDANSCAVLPNEPPLDYFWCSDCEAHPKRLALKSEYPYPINTL